MTHEFGHKLGLDHDSPDHVMRASLAPVLTADCALALVLPTASKLGLADAGFTAGPPFPGCRDAQPSAVEHFDEIGHGDQFFAYLADQASHSREDERIDAFAEVLSELRKKAGSRNGIDEELLDALLAGQ